MELVKKLIAGNHSDEFSATSGGPSISCSPLSLTSRHFPDVIPTSERKSNKRDTVLYAPLKNIPEILCFLYSVMCVGCGLYVFDIETDEARKINHAEDQAVMLDSNEDLKNEETKVMHRRNKLFLMTSEELEEKYGSESPNTVSSPSNKYQCLVEKYYESTSGDNYISSYPIPVPNLLYVVDILEKLCQEMTPDKNERDIEEETVIVEGEMREVLPGIVMRVTKPYPSSTLLNSEENSGTQRQPKVKVEEINVDIMFGENKKVYDAETVQNCISHIFPQQHRSKSFENFKKFLDYLPFYVSRIEPYVNVAEKYPFLYYLMKIGKYRL